METIVTQDGSLTIKHPGLDEAYHSHAGAKTEAQELYVKSSSFLKHLTTKQSVCVLDVGMGLGYNAMATLSATAPSACHLSLISLEHDASILTAFLSGEAAWQKNWPTQNLAIIKSIQHISPMHLQYKTPKLSWDIFLGDAQGIDFKTLPAFDYIWQDPFSPSKNPDMWSTTWFSKLYQAAQPQCELLTYSVARCVKDALHTAQWQVQRIPGHSTKKHWLKATPSV